MYQKPKYFCRKKTYADFQDIIQKPSQSLVGAYKEI